MNNSNINNRNDFTFNFNKFKILKKDLNKYFLEKYWETINQKFRDKKIREAVFKYILWFEWNTDIFQSWRLNNINDFNLSDETIKIINDLKEHTKLILYKRK